MKLTNCISGIRVEDFDIDPVFESWFITLDQVTARIHTQKAMDYILDKFRFSAGRDCWFITINHDEIYKISIMERHPDLDKELTEKVGENWPDYYLRFNH